jgi:ASC-1-like (ASCH) protein
VETSFIKVFEKAGGYCYMQGGTKKFDLNKMKKIIAFVIFVILICICFIRISYLFRNVLWAEDRNHLTAIKNEDDLDVVYIGGSAAFVYWEPDRAYGEYGITSYDYAANSITAESVLGYVKEVLKTQRPKLIVIDARPFQYWSDTSKISEIRETTDSWDYSVNREETAGRWLKYRKRILDMDGSECQDGALTYYLDIIKYHGNLDALKNPDSWNFIDNVGKVDYHGFEPRCMHETLTEPDDFETDENTPLPEEDEKILDELLEYCKNRKINVLFTVCPYYVSADHMKLYNTIQKRVEEKGFDFINCNLYYNEMGLDFSRDFYEVSHVNPYGAEKYTKFLGNYIKNKYLLADHRGEESYADWDNEYKNFLKSDAGWKASVDAVISEEKTAYEDGLQLKDMTNVYEWLECIKNDNYYVLLEGRGKKWMKTNQRDVILRQFNIPLEDFSKVIRVYCGEESEYANTDDTGADYKNSFSGHSDYTEDYEINSGELSSIVISGQDFSRKQDGLNIVVYDKNHRKVLDSVALVQDASGKIALVR